ncbi:hypothetical protein Theco_0975 [Thermobacillus composti KWC4]|uniref:Uncharacterized protein n=1 Tax=Thermobacillus composti (strain DSM 18247 / JCM 13945 / KWC4) TaxID=717605 RepID=L0EBV3_THECK|nr:hypothetical protein [Thermobacillus composti]AGA57161.1 hypothetical protein Theco_0975 [Thermobacillus composti KWC4]
MRSKSFVRLLSALLALSVATAGYPLRDAAAAEKFFARHAYTDPSTGEVFFDVIRNSEPYQLVVFRTADGEWMRLPDGVRGIGLDDRTGCVRVSTYSAPFHDVCYDAAADALVYTTAFEPSPSGKWGLKIVSFYESYVPTNVHTSTPQPSIHYGSHTSQKQHLLLLKNNATGEIRQLAISDRYPDYRWLADGTLLLERFSETARQNELVRINPATGEAKRFMLASLRGYNAEHNLLLYVMNEPSRKLRIYDFRTGKSRLAKEGETELFYPETEVSREERPEPPSLPEDLDLDALPVAGTGIRHDYAAVLTLDGADVQLPFAYVGLDGETYVPLKPFVARGWTMRQESSDGGHEYVVDTGRGELRLNRANSISLNDRLYLQLRLIRSLGHEAELRWLR